MKHKILFLFVITSMMLLSIFSTCSPKILTASDKGKIDSLKAATIHIGELAQMYFAEDKETGGGGNSFYGFKIPEDLKTTSVGTFNVDLKNSTFLTVTGIGYLTGKDGSTPIKIISKVNPKYQKTEREN
jgi:hypothetical protein